MFTPASVVKAGPSVLLALLRIIVVSLDALLAAEGAVLVKVAFPVVVVFSSVP